MQFTAVCPLIGKGERPDSGRGEYGFMAWQDCRQRPIWGEPGIPAVLPGQRLNEAVLRYLRQGTEAGLVIPDAADPEVFTIAVATGRDPRHTGKPTRGDR